MASDNDDVKDDDNDDVNNKDLKMLKSSQVKH